jgi:hypothetical protein
MGAMTGEVVERCRERDAIRSGADLEDTDAEKRGRRPKACMGRGGMKMLEEEEMAASICRS